MIPKQYVAELYRRSCEAEELAGAARLMEGYTLLLEGLTEAEALLTEAVRDEDVEWAEELVRRYRGEVFQYCASYEVPWETILATRKCPAASPVQPSVRTRLADIWENVAWSPELAAALGDSPAARSRRP